jgi:hypothetical protein
MKRSHVILLLAVLLVCIVGGSLGLIAYWQRPQPVDGPAIAQGVADFCIRQRARGMALPASITLQELVKEGFLQPEAIRGFGGTEVTIALQVDERNPQSILMQAHLPDGSRVEALGDGSVVQLK